MLQVGRASAALLAVIISGCSLAATDAPSGSPIASASSPDSSGISTPTPPSSSLGPTTTPEPPATQSPGPTPTVERTPTVEPTPLPTPTVAENDVWHAADPLPRGTTITGLIGGWELVVSGNVAAPTESCPNRTEAHVWTEGPSGWFDVFVGTRIPGTIDVLIGPNLHAAIGHSTTDCDTSSPAMFAPTDKADWYWADVAGLSGRDEFVEGIGLSTPYQRILTGSAAGDSDHMAVWIGSDSDDTFRRASRPPERSHGGVLYSLAAIDEEGGVVIGFDGTSTLPAWFSTDFGDTWHNSESQPPFWFLTTDAVAMGRRLFAAGMACCTGLGQGVGAVISSEDGAHWDYENAQLLPTIPEAIVSTETGLIALGERTYVSDDGSDWRVGTRLPGYPGGDTETWGTDLFAAVEDSAVFAATPAGQIWRASAVDLEAGGRPAVQQVERPQVGYSKDTLLNTTCGPFDGPLYFDLRMWVPDLPGGDWPSSFDSLAEHGSFHFVDPDRLEFTGSRGDVVVYRPTMDPPASFPCA